MIKECAKEVQMHVRHTLESLHDKVYFKSPRGPHERAEMDEVLRSFIFRYLYYMISDNGKLLPQLFTAAQKDKFPATVEDAINVDLSSLVALSRSDSFYSIDETASAKNYRHTGRNCGRAFQPGEPLYRCRECAYDDTCVLCISCFNPNDHINHHVSTHICSEFNDGICDCGDVEAWNVPLCCKADEEAENDMDDGVDMFKNERMVQIIGAVLTEVFNHFIEVFNQNLEPLPTIQKDLTVKLREMIQDGKIKEKAELLHALAYRNSYMESKREVSSENSSLEAADQDTGPALNDYVVLIYNDEYHNYSQATSALRQGGPDNKHTDLLAARIDGEGRAMLKCSHDLSSVIGGFFSVQTNGLSATLTSWSEYIHQEACKYLIYWVKSCLSIPNESFQEVFREVMGTVLCSEYDCASNTIDMTEVVDKYFLSEKNLNGLHTYADMSVLGKGNVIPLGHHKVLPPDSLDSISIHLNRYEEPESRYYLNSRLQLILYFDNRYWKKLRGEVHRTIIPTLASSLKYKPMFSEQVVQIFNHMTRSVAFMDREPQLTALTDCVVQLFTCPTTVKNIFENKKFPDIMWSVIDIFTEFSKVEGGVFVWQRVQRSNPSKSYSYLFKHGLYAIETLLSKVEDPNLILRPAEFISIVTLCKLFNGAWKIKRKEGEHVLREDQHFILYLEYTTSIYSIIQAIDKVLESARSSISEDALLGAIRLLNTFLGYRTLPYKLVLEAHDVIDFKVSKERVAFMNPVHTLFSYLIEKVPLKKAFESISSTKDFLTIADFPLRAVVLCSQIDVGFWVRNGMSVLHQSSYYRTNPEINSYSRDIHLYQLAFLRENDDLPRVIYNLLDRWELLDWFTGKEQYDAVYEERITHILQQFIAFVYQILSERHFFKIYSSQSEKEACNMKNVIIYNLLMKPLSYSDLLKAVPDYLSERNQLFDRSLAEVSEYVEPKGLEDSGVFKLKKEMYKKIDPLSLLNMKNDFEHSATIVKSKLNECGGNPSKVVLHPQLIHPKHMDELAVHLGDFTRTRVFAKLIYKLLQNCIDRDDGAYLYELLYLIHAIFKDDEMLRDENSIPDAYISKPICNLLMTIESNPKVFSENAVNKADDLLENMIRKRPNDIFESLIAYFGQEFVDHYKKRKMNQGVNFEETEKDRKKRLAKLRQRKIMAKFSKQQDKFVKENEGLISNGDDTEIIDDSKTDELVCSLCQDEDSNDAFVIPAYHESSPVFLYGDYTPGNFSKDWDSFNNNDESPTIYSDLKLYSFQEARHGGTKTFVSCNHIIHYECFRRYVQKKRFLDYLFICPLCQTFSNCVLPIPRSPKQHGKTSISVDQLLVQPSDVNFLDLLIDEGIPDSVSSVNMLKEICKKSTSYDRSYSNVSQEFVACILTCHWANTICMIEVASRIDKNPHATLLQGKEQKFKTLKSVLNTISWFYKCMGPPRQKFAPYVFHGDDDGPANQIFQYIAHKSLFSGTPISETISHALSIWMKTLVTQFISHSFEQGFENVYSDTVVHGPLFAAPVELKPVWKNLLRADYMENPELLEKMFHVTYTMLVKTLLPTLRRCLIMLKVFSGLLSGDELHVEGINLTNGLDTTDLPVYFNTLIKLLTKNSFANLFHRIEGEPMDHHYLRNISMEYAGTVKLVNLAKYLNTYVTNTKELKLRDESSVAQMKNVKNRLDFKICLTCGVRVYSRGDGTEMVKHMAKNCFKPYGLFLIPHDSEVRLVLQHPHSHISIPAPYLNSHGESGKNAIQRGDLTTLSLQRYEHLNQLWLNNEIPGYISRMMGDEFRVSIISSGVVFNFDRNVLRRQMRGTLANDESSDEEDLVDEEDMSPDEETNFRWEVTPEEFFRDGILRLGVGPGQGGDIRDFFQFITNLRTDEQNQTIQTFQLADTALQRRRRPTEEDEEDADNDTTEQNPDPR